ncbi:MAG: hypothetical protein EPN72_14000 [Nevskiaceae bacterium]|nr:MAG: hypothetical protein EPN63_14330 [Nevskiaceae bacterium]TBR71569.1 MAG: hypothetical protein EPN72_14000 [Nevskiaceae bacterium]
MAINKSDLERVRHLNILLGSGDSEAVKQWVLAEADDDLLGDDALDAARVANLIPAVVYLATLGAANLPEPNDRQTWLAAYQSLSGNREAPALAEVSDLNPVKWITRALVGGHDVVAEGGPLRRCAGRKTPVGAWIAACELAMDRHRFDLVEQMMDIKLSAKTSLEDWMHLSNALTRRHEYLKEVWNGAAMGRALLRIRKHLPAHPLFDDVRSLLAVYAGDYLMRGGEYASAIAVASQSRTPADHEAKLTVIAEALCKQGDLAGCIRHLDEILALQVESPRVEKLKALYQVREEKTEAAHDFDVAAASRSLADLQQILDGCNQKAFLMSGTLLGYARDGGLLKHDKDIDVGIMHWQDQYNVVAALMKSGLFRVRIESIGDSEAHYIPIMHTPTHVTTDIFIGRLVGDRYVTTTPHFYGHQQSFAFTPFTLQRVDFLETQVYVPSDVERNLAENFGPGWRVSDPDYQSFLESPVLIDAGGLDYQITGRLLFLRYLWEGKITKVQRILDCLKTHKDRPSGLLVEILDRLAPLVETLAGLRAETDRAV